MVTRSSNSNVNYKRKSSNSSSGSGSSVGSKSATPRYGRLAFHVITAGIMINGFTALQNIAIMKELTPQGHMERAEQRYKLGTLQYLTILGLIATAITMAVSGINDLLPSISGVSNVKRFLMLFTLPVEITIASIYWPLILLMPQLMVPQGPGEPTSASADGKPGQGGQLMFIPLWIDLSLHAVPALALIFDFFIFEKRYTPPVSNRHSPFIAAAFGAGYVAWVEYCASHNDGVFPYPFLTLASDLQRGIIYTVATGFAWAVFRGLNWLHS